jgi:N-formylglutamate deformylase
MSSDWLTIERGRAPLILSIPHAGMELPESYQPGLRSLWLARKDADWWLPQLYVFAEDLGATILRTHISRTIIDVNRDPSGASLYPGQATTGLCPLTTFDGELLYLDGMAPGEAEIAARRDAYFEPYHQAVSAEIKRLRQVHKTVILYDCHSIRSEISRLFSGLLPNFNIGTNDGKACAPELTQKIADICGAANNTTYVVNGRFKGGWITRHHGNPADGVHAVQMELACRGYMVEPAMPNEQNWPSQYDENEAAPMRAVLKDILQTAIKFAEGQAI